MDDELLQFQAVASKVATMVDGGNSILLHTQEMSPQQSMKLFSLKGKEAWWVGKPNKIVEEDVPDIEAEVGTGQKTQAQRIRGALYVAWEQNADKKQYPEFELYYKAKTDRIIDKIKETLN